MSMKVVEGGLLFALQALGNAYNDDVLKIGLYKNDWTPALNDDITAVTPADFGGYAGEQDLDSWDVGGIAFVDPRYVMTHPNITWTANGASTNTVYGYYVTSNAGVLLWAERRATGGVTVGTVNGQTYVVAPLQTDRSEF
jgi:hypothetical protein